MNREKIDWKYFFGCGSDRYYYAEIRGVRVEQHKFKSGAKFSIGNIDTAKKKHKTESALLKEVLQQTTNAEEIPPGGWRTHYFNQNQ